MCLYIYFNFLLYLVILCLKLYLQSTNKKLERIINLHIAIKVTENFRKYEFPINIIDININFKL